VQALRRILVGRDALQREYARGGLVPHAGEILVEAREFDRAAHAGLHHLRADAAAPHEQALVDELLDRPSHRRAGEPEALADGDLVLEAGARGDHALADRALEAAGDLEVQGYRAGAIEVGEELVRPHGGSAHGPSLEHRAALIGGPGHAL